MLSPDRASKEHFTALWKLLPAWLLPAVSPAYEVALAGKEFPVGLELALLACVFIYCVWVHKFVDVLNSIWIAVLAIYGSVGLIHLALGLFGVPSGKTVIGLMVAAFCMGATLLATSSESGQASSVPETESIANTGWARRFAGRLVGTYCIWVMASFFDALLADRFFLLNSQTRDAGSWFVVVIFCLSLLGSLVAYWKEPGRSRIAKVLMPVAVSFLAACIGLVAFGYGLVFAIHALAVGHREEATYVVSELRRDATRRAMCPYALTIKSRDGRASGRKCISEGPYRRLKAGDQLRAQVLVTPFGSLILSPRTFLASQPIRAGE